MASICIFSSLTSQHYFSFSLSFILSPSILSRVSIVLLCAEFERICFLTNRLSLFLFLSFFDISDVFAILFLKLSSLSLYLSLSVFQPFFQPFFCCCTTGIFAHASWAPIFQRYFAFHVSFRNGEKVFREKGEIGK